MLQSHENQTRKNKQRLNRLRLLDDNFMNKVFEDLDCTKLLLQIILNKPDLTVQRNDKGAQPKRARYFKEDTKGVTTMCDAWDEMKEECIQEGLQKKATEIAKNLLQMKKLSHEDIAISSGLTLATVQSLAEQLQSA